MKSIIALFILGFSLHSLAGPTSTGGTNTAYPVGSSAAHMFREWKCDSGFKSSLSNTFVTTIQLGINGKYTLSLGQSPSDTGGGKLIEPVQIASGLNCKFALGLNGQVVRCLNDQQTGAWFDLRTYHHTITDMDSGTPSTREVVEVIISAGEGEAQQRLLQFSKNGVVRYNVNLGMPGTKCGYL